MNNYIFYDYVYDHHEISNLIKYYEQKTNWSRVGKIRTSDDQEQNCNRYFTSLNYSLSPNKIIEKYINFLPSYTAASLDQGLSKCTEYVDDNKIAKYIENDCYNWHNDCWIKREGYETLARQLSAITYLNDNFVGGETEFECGVIIKPKTGKTVIFPSTWCFPHRGRPVKEGTKYVYVSHIWA
jgi:hypothetical protein